MKSYRWVFMLILSCVVGIACADVDLTAHIANPGFEEPAILFPDEKLDGALGWNSSGGRQNLSGGIGAETQFIDGSLVASEGNHVAELYGAFTSQHLGSVTIQPATTYTLTADVAVPTDSLWPDLAYFNMTLSAYESITALDSFGDGYTPLGEVFSPGDPNYTPEVWYTVDCSFDSSTVPELVGESLYFHIQGDYLKVDNVTLTATGTQVDLAVSVTSGAEGALLGFNNGAGTYPVGDGWVIALDAMSKFADANDLYTFDEWTGATVPADHITEVTIAGNTAVDAKFTKTTPGATSVVLPKEYLEIANPSFEGPVLIHPEEGAPYWLDLADGAIFECGNGNGVTSPAPAPGWMVVGGTHFLKNPAAVEGLMLNYGVHGDNTLFSVGSAGQYFQIYQNLGKVIEENSVYTMSVDVYLDPAETWHWFGMKYQIVGTPYHEVEMGAIGTGVTGLPGYALGEWFTVELEYTPTAGDSDSDMQILIQAAGLYIDNVRISKVATVQAIAATVTLASDPAGANIEPDAGVYTLPLGYELPFAAVSKYAYACPEIKDFDQWQGGNGRITRPQLADQKILIDDDMTFTASYVSDGTIWDTCGDICNPFSDMDFDYSCQVNLDDFSTLANDWPKAPNGELYIFNGSFDLHQIAVGDKIKGVPEDWLATVDTARIINLGFASDYDNLYVINAVGGHTLYQPLCYRYEADTTYRLMVDIMIPSFDNGSYWVPNLAWWKLEMQSLANGNASLVEGTAAAAPSMAYDQWYTISCDFDSATDPTKVDDGIQIAFTGANVYIDNFRMVKMEEPSLDYLSTFAEQWLDSIE